MNISHSCTCTNVDSTGLNGIHVYFYRLEEPILHLLGGLWTCLLVITSPNQNLCGWNLEHKWRATVHTHTRKMGEITQGVPLKGAKTCFVCFFCYKCNTAFRPFLKQQTWIAFRMRPPVKNLQISAHRVFHIPKQPKIWYCRAVCVCTPISANGSIPSSESFRGLADIPTMCLLYVSFAGDVRFGHYKPAKKPNFRLPSTTSGPYAGDNSNDVFLFARCHYSCKRWELIF